VTVRELIDFLEALRSSGYGDAPVITESESGRMTDAQGVSIRKMTFDGQPDNDAAVIS